MEQTFEVPNNLVQQAKENIKNDCRKNGWNAVCEYYRIYAKLSKHADGTIIIPAEMVNFLEELEEVAKEVDDETV